MARKVRYNFLVDDIKICFCQPDSFFNYIHTQMENEMNQHFGGQEFYLDKKDFGIGFLRNDVGSERISCRLLMPIPKDNDVERIDLGELTIHNDQRYHNRSFFVYNLQSQYFIDGIDINGTKYNLCQYPLMCAEQLGLEFNNVSKLEVALDINQAVIYKFRTLIHDYDHFTMIFKGKQVTDKGMEIPGIAEYSPVSRARKSRKPTLYMRARDCELKVYDKERELADKQKKKAVEEWDGYDGKCERVEVTVNNTGFKAYLKYLNDSYLNSKNGQIAKDIPEYWIHDHVLSETELYFNILMQEQEREAIFDYVSQRLIRFRIRNHDKTLITPLDIVSLSIRELREQVKRIKLNDKE